MVLEESDFCFYLQFMLRLEQKFFLLYPLHVYVHVHACTHMYQDMVSA